MSAMGRKQTQAANVCNGWKPDIRHWHSKRRLAQFRSVQSSPREIFKTLAPLLFS
jgi:hypothetical protein